MQLWGKSEQIAGFLDRGIHITGELQFSGILRIDGHFHGSISSSDSLIIGEHAVLHADIQVGELEVHGQIFGNVAVQGRTEIFPTGRLRGDLQTATLIIQSGGILNGHSLMAVEDSADAVRETTRALATEQFESERDSVDANSRSK
jgi:cytoskeletal protein CcmA (bactofilin family)